MYIEGGGHVLNIFNTYKNDLPKIVSLFSSKLLEAWVLVIRCIFNLSFTPEKNVHVSLKLKILKTVKFNT